MQQSWGERGRALWCYQATRRHFMRQAGLAMAGAVMTPWMMPVHAGADTDASVFRAYVGCYTTAKRNGRGQGIAAYDVNARDGQWRLLQITPTEPNPSYLVADRGGRTLYSVHGDESLVSFYRIEDSGKLTMLGHHDTGGVNGVHLVLSPDERFALVANYATGSIAVFPREPSGALQPRSQLLELTGAAGPVADQQKGPQPHEIRFVRGSRQILVPDKGVDAIHRLDYDPASGQIAIAGGPVRTPPGSGPRHLEFHPNLPLLYLVDELSSQLTVYHLDTLSPTQVISTLPADFSGESTAAEIALSRDGRYVFVSNRGHDSVATFGLTANGLALPPGFISSGGEQPRFMTFDAAGTVLYVANQRTDTVVPFTLNPVSGALTPTTTIPAYTPSSIVFVAAVPAQ